MSIEIKVKCIELAIGALRHKDPTAAELVETAKMIEDYIAPQYVVSSVEGALGVDIRAGALNDLASVARSSKVSGAI